MSVVVRRLLAVIRGPADGDLTDLLPQQGRAHRPGVPDQNRTLQPPLHFRNRAPATTSPMWRSSSVAVISWMSDSIGTPCISGTTLSILTTEPRSTPSTSPGESAADPPQDRGVEERLHPPRRGRLSLLRAQRGYPCMTQYQVALAFEDGVTRFVTCMDDQTVADASYRAPDQHPAGLPRRGLRDMQGVLRVRRIPNSGIYPRRCAVSRTSSNRAMCCPAWMKLNRIWCWTSPARRRSPKPRPRRIVGEITEFHPAVTQHRLLSPSRSRTVTSWLPARPVRQHRGARHRRAAGPTRSAMRPTTNEPDLPGEADARRGDVDLPR